MKYNASMEKRMYKVCHLSSVHSANDTRILIKECSSLAKKYKVILIACSDKEERVNNIRIIPFKKINNRFFRILFSPIIMFFTTIKYKADIYHVHDPELLITLMLLKLFTHSKLIYDIHEDVVSDIQSKTYLTKFTKKVVIVFFSIIEKFAVKLSDYNITATPYIRDKFLKLNQNTLDINNYPIIDELKAERNPKDKVICYIGNITEIRGLSNIIKSLEYIDVELHLAGEYEPIKYREELISHKGWSKVKEHGYINRKKMKEILSFSNAGLVLFEPEPNHVNAQPNKLFEYMSASLPVIGSDFPLWRKIVLKNNCGILVDPQNPKDIANAIQYLIDYPEEAKIMGKNGREAVEKYYNWQNEEKKLFDVYNKLIGK